MYYGILKQEKGHYGQIKGGLNKAWTSVNNVQLVVC